MDTNKMREQFEAALAKETASKAPDEKKQVLEAYGGFERLLRETLVDDRLGDTYGHNVFACAWWAWQASREAVVVELPAKISAHNTTEGGFVRPEAEHYDEAVDDCREAIEAQGLKVSP